MRVALTTPSDVRCMATAWRPYPSTDLLGMFAMTVDLR